MMNFLGNLFEFLALLIPAMLLLKAAQWLRRNIDFNEYDDTE